jgi:hypothetical protein
VRRQKDEAPMKTAMLTAAIAGLIALGSVAEAEGGTVHVASHGTDSPGFGAKADLCRTLTQAISNAGAGDTVLVGPGRYGDVNGSGSFDDPEDEAPDAAGCECIVSVSKPLKVLLRDGAAASVIDGNGVPVLDVVRISPRALLLARGTRLPCRRRAGGPAPPLPLTFSEVDSPFKVR